MLRTPAYERAYEQCTHTRAHTTRVTPSLLIHTFHLAHWHKHAHARTYTNMYARIIFCSLSRSRSLPPSYNIRISVFTGEYMPMYVRVHIQSTSRMCSFYGDYIFATVLDWKKKQQGTSRPRFKCHHSIINIIIIVIVNVVLISSRHEQNVFYTVQNIKRQRKQQQCARACMPTCFIRHTQRKFVFLSLSLCTFLGNPDTKRYKLTCVNNSKLKHVLFLSSIKLSEF